MTVTSPHKTEPPSQTRKGRLFLKLAAASAALMLIWAVAGLFLYVKPQAASPAHADVLFVLGPPDQRMGSAEKLMHQGYAPTHAVSVPLGKDGTYDDEICNAQCRHPYQVVCFHPEPFTTQGEARALRDLSAKYGWKRTDVLTAQFHVTRARAIVDRCYKGELHMVADRRKLPLVSLTDFAGSWVYEYLYQTAAFVKVALNQSC